MVQDTIVTKLKNYRKLKLNLFWWSSQPEYLNWDTKQPNDWVDGGKKNKGDNPQGCVDIGNKGVEKKTWNDQACSALNNFVCEKSLENINAGNFFNRRDEIL